MGNTYSAQVLEEGVNAQQDCSQGNTGDPNLTRADLSDPLSEHPNTTDTDAPVNEMSADEIHTPMGTVKFGFKFDLLTDSSSFIANYIDRANPIVDAIKTVHAKLDSREKVSVASDILRSMNDHEWAELMMKVELREVRYDVVGNLPGELVQQISDYLDPEDILKAQLVSTKWKGILSTPAFYGGQVASHFGVKAAADPRNTPSSDLFRAFTRRYHGHKMGRPFERYEFPLPRSNDARLDFQNCHFDYSRGCLAFLEFSGGMLRALHWIQVSTMLATLLHTFPEDLMESIRMMKMSERLVVFLSEFGFCYIFDLGTATTRSHLYKKVKLPSSDYQALLVVGDKVAIVFNRMICYWNARDRTLGTFALAMEASTFAWAMLHPTRDAFVTATWEHGRDTFGSYLRELVTAVHSFDEGRVLGMGRISMKSPSYRIGPMTEFLYHSCYQDDARHIGVYSMVNNVGSMIATGLGDFLIEHNFAEDLIFVKPLDTQGFKARTRKLPSDLDMSYIPGGFLSFVLPTGWLDSHYVYNVNEADINTALVIPEYRTTDVSGICGDPDHPTRSRYAFTDGKFHVILCERAIQVWSYNEDFPPPSPEVVDHNFRYVMASGWFTRSAARKQWRDMVAVVESVRPKPRFLLEQ